ncbi:hypothetical protein RSal33209_3511 [Renibacterium salmoninarum ATCC 33209]|uniref:Uncharacterized protein n=1 Tax=Renibacterium salmoninarum (strain ATCC 33209 / DSM 20767 / JCM 11484 / NBRC 15589 / NCIMB 2235) TaxID=288705 RepID=A9WVJ9_RENSM|nr:hypothetical protein [Renibacterium salmoninarum]ABY25220.1 hypothetical protein RSal33209_3511 [Renibacterium salmoninarum ATCC 33209]
MKTGGGAVDTLLTTLKNALNVNILAASVKVTNATATIDGLDTAAQTITTQLLQTPIQNATGSIKINLADGSIELDLAKLLAETPTGGDINALPPNSQVLSAEMITAILDGISSSISGLTTKITDTTTQVLNNLNLTLNIGLNACVGIPPRGTCADGGVLIKGKLSDFAGTTVPPTSPVVTTTLSVGPLDLGAAVNAIVQPLVNTAITPVTTGLTPAVNALTAPLLTTIKPILDQVLAKLVQLTINEQPTKLATPGPGDLGADSFTVRALSLTLLPNGTGSGLAKVSLASSTVRATVAAVPTIAVTRPPSQQERPPASPAPDGTQQHRSPSNSRTRPVTTLAHRY